MSIMRVENCTFSDVSLNLYFKNALPKIADKLFNLGLRQHYFERALLKRFDEKFIRFQRRSDWPGPFIFEITANEQGYTCEIEGWNIT